MLMDFDALWRWAEEHHGLVRADELRVAGISGRRRRSIQTDDLERLSPRVFRRLGSPRTPYQQALAAVLDAGQGVVLGGDACAWSWSLPGFPFVVPVELARERGVSRLKRETLGKVRERRELPPHHVTIVAGLPTLTLPVLLYQLAGREPRRFARIADTVAGRSPAVLRALHDLLPEMAERGRNGITAMRSYLDERPPGLRVPTGLEAKFERTLSDGGERPLRRQVDLGGHEWIGRVDYYDDDGLIVEVQSTTFHDSYLDRASDEVRVADLLAAGFRGVLFIDEHMVWYQPQRVVEAVRLARAAVRSKDPSRFVIAICALGARFAMTEAGGDAMTGRGAVGGRMSA